MQLHVMYRISDKGNEKEKLPYATKFGCLLNAVRNFGLKNFYVIADNCNPETIQFLKLQRIAFEETALGNSQSFVYAINKICDTLAEDAYVYLLEDDYFHLPGSRQALLEGLQLADYVTLYDHPDAYHLYRNGGGPMNEAVIRPCQVLLSAHHHWRTAISTTMTFAAQVKTLKEDYDILVDQPEKGVPLDFKMFVRLSKLNTEEDYQILYRLSPVFAHIIRENQQSSHPHRILISPIPALSTHCEMGYLSPNIDWMQVEP